MVRGATYGTFRPDAAGDAYPAPAVVDSDFAAMTANGLNATRTYTVPPRWLLDSAWRHGLRIMVGLPWEQHVAFLDDPGRARSIEQRVRAAVRGCAGHPAVLCYAVGSEIPCSIARWHGRLKVERFLKRLYTAVKEEDPDALATYVNYPSTEYLQLPFVDLLCFNVYLEAVDRLRAYIARLHNLAGDRPVILGEVGLDSRRSGALAQARTVAEQIEAIFASGCAGTFVFSWTDEWNRSGHDVEDWDFGLVDRERRPKPALAAARRAFARVPFSSGPLPFVSVVVCCRNSAETLGECLSGIGKLDYPGGYETIVVDDGSTDETAEIARSHGARTISIESRGLGHARNVGLRAARGEIVAYIDGDASPDVQWLRYLVESFMRSQHVGIGGPNIAPPDGPVADCVANAPGGPIHVLLSDTVAEHIPGCNMAFRRSALERVGGFDPQFHTAGDDVDICWRLQQQGWTLGFSPAAFVWHRRRNSVRAYWRQQVGYGAAEGLLEHKWPDRYNASGHATWAGRIYGNGLATFLAGERWRIYHGKWGTGPFQQAEPVPTPLRVLPLMPEWFVAIAFLALLSLVTPIWPRMLMTLPLLGLGAAASMVQAVRGAAHASFASPARSRRASLTMRALTALLYLMQPIARLWGRLRHAAGRPRSPVRLALPVPRAVRIWSERWHLPEARLDAIRAALHERGRPTRCGGPFAAWDLEAAGGPLGATRLRMAVEDHGAGTQLVIFRIFPRPSRTAVLLLALFCGLTAASVVDDARFAALVFGVTAVALGARLFRELGTTVATVLEAVECQPGEELLEHCLSAVVGASALSGTDVESVGLDTSVVAAVDR